jgi:ribosomal-protein-alanine N-acetyltransferase
VTGPKERIHLAHIAERDVAEVAAIDAVTFPQTRPAEEHVREELSRPWTRAWVAREANDASDAEAANTTDATERARVVGYLLSWHVADELHILQVAAAPAERRRGIGRALVDEALAYCARERVRLVLLEVRRSNLPAIALYRRVGFVASNVRRAYYNDGEDAVEMQLELDPATGARVPRVDEAGLDV